LENPSIEGLMAVPINMKEDWRTSFREYLLTTELPLERNEVIHLTRRAIKYCLVDEVLYRRSVLTLLFKCLSPRESFYVLRESIRESMVYTPTLELLSLRSS